MRKIILKAAAGCLFGIITMSVSQLHVEGATIGTEMASAGISVALENYCEESQDPETEIVAMLQPIVTAAQEEDTDSIYDNVAIAKVDDYVNVRKKPNVESKIVGKIYDGCAATIISTEGEWYKIESGNVKGYIKAEYFLTGKEGRKAAIKEGYVVGTVNTETLNVRETQSTESTILTQIPEGGEYDVIKYGDGWVKVNIDGDVQGWVSQEFMDISVDYDTALTLKEEKKMLEEKERREREAAEAEERMRQAEAEEESRRAAEQEAANSYNDNSYNDNSYSNYEEPTEAPTQAPSYDSSSSSATRDAVVAYASQFIGNPYVYGGTSLTNGTDCSGFTMGVYAKFGYSLPHSSAAQSGYGSSVSLDSLLPGDLLFYSNGGGIGHVAIYMGGGQIVHASTERTGITVSNAFYRTPVCARRLIG